MHEIFAARGTRFVALSAIFLVIAMVIILVPSIPQDPEYHNFADQRSFFAIPNFWNVVSNLPFLLVGFYGLARTNVTKGPIRLLVLVYGVGMFLVCAGSSWYHLNPMNASLVWDRLAMTVSFMTVIVFVAVRISAPRRAHWMLWPLIAIGFLSVIYWNITEMAGRGDLRFYALVQFLPGLLIPVYLLTAPERFGAAVSRFIWLGLAAYVAAKIAEWQDAGLYALGAWLSGHSVKHMLAALSAYFFLRAMLVNDMGQETEQ